MKKLLSILAAIGLTATTGTAVVACGTDDSKTKVKEITDFLTIDKLTLGEVDSPDAATTAANDVIKLISDLVGKVDLGTPANNKIHVTVNQAGQDTLTGETDFTFTVKPGKKDIGQLLEGELDLGLVEDNEAATIAANKVIAGIPDLVGNVDLATPEVIENKGKIKVTVNQAGQDTLTGKAEFLFTVKPPKKDIGQLLEGELDLGLVEDNEAATIAANKVIAGIPDLVGNVDLATPEVIGNKGKIKVTVNQAGQDTLTGKAEFLFTVKPGKKDIGQLLEGELDLGLVEYNEAATIAANKVIAGIPDLVGKVDLATPEVIGNKGKIKVTVNQAGQDTLTGKAEFLFTVKPVKKDIGQLLEGELDLGLVEDNEAATIAANKVIAGIPDLVGNVDLATPEVIENKGKIKVTVNQAGQDTLTGKAEFLFTVKPPKKDIGQLLEGELDLGPVEDDDAATDAANEVIKDIPDLVGKVKLDAPEKRKIHVSPKEGETSLTGETDFTYSLIKDSEEIVNAIKSTLFTKSVSVNSSAAEVKIGVGAKFIKDRLTEEFSNLFIDDLFTLKSIMNDQGTELSDSDLEVAGPIQLTINYRYDSFENESTNLLITIKEIKKTPERDKELKILADDLNRVGDKGGFSGNWLNYFYAIENDIERNLFTFEFSEESLREDRIAQNIIYDEIQLIIRTDFKANNIDITKKYFDPDTVKVKYMQFQIYEKGKEIIVTSELTIDVKNNADGKYHPINVLFYYTFNYSLV